jgi:hypothetical protein
MRNPFKKKPPVVQCAFVGGGLRCMRIEHETGKHSTFSPLPLTVWDPSEDRWRPWNAAQLQGGPDA